MCKSTLFIAVQCCQCSTMQVKQQKKNSNKWTCMICNQKQSVKKIYAQGYQAKDVRQFVQSFNMSRKVVDEQAVLEYEAPSVGHFVEHLEGSRVEEEHKPKRRTDWSEYVEDEENTDPPYLKSLTKEKEMFKPDIVMEIPDGLMFRKAKLKGKFVDSSSSSGLGDNQKYKPRFSKKDANKKTCISQVPGNFKRGWEEGEQELQYQQQNKQMGKAKRGVCVSKWSKYMMEDENPCFGEEKATVVDDFKIMCGNDLKTAERVEEDIHPDFL